MQSEIAINPDIANIPLGERKRLTAAAAGKTDLADLASGNPDFAAPPYIVQRLQGHLAQSAYMPYTTDCYGVSALPGVSCVRPPGGFYVSPNFKSLGSNSADLSLALIEQAGVVARPGTEFGSHGEGYLRLSVCARREHVEKGVTRLAQFVRQHR